MDHVMKRAPLFTASLQRHLSTSPGEDTVADNLRDDPLQLYQILTASFLREILGFLFIPRTVLVFYK